MQDSKPGFLLLASVLLLLFGGIFMCDFNQLNSLAYIPKDKKDIIIDIVPKLVKLYEKHLVEIRLYGSYSRGDFTPESDIDIAVILNLPNENLNYLDDELTAVISKYLVSYYILISVQCISSDLYYEYRNIQCFYGSIYKEGISLYDRTTR